MKTTLRAVLAICVSLVASLANADDIDGTWLVTIDAPTGTSKSTLVLKQDGDAITGQYTGQFGKAPVSGIVRNNDVLLTYHVEMQGVPLEITYSGTLDGSTLSGKVVVHGFGEGTFKGTKQQ